MKIIVILLLLSTLIMADNQPKQVDNSIQLQNYNQRPSIKLKHKLKLKHLATVSETEAKKIATRLCDEPVSTLQLLHKGQPLFYAIKTTQCHVKINALNGSVISKVKNNEKK